MLSYSTIAIIVILAMLLAALLFLALPWMVKKGWDVGGILKTADDVIETTEIALDTIKPLCFANPYINIADKILEYAQVAVKQSEQLCLIGQLQPEQRKKQAQDFLYRLLVQIGVPVTDQIKQIASGAIEASVFTLGHIKAAENLNPPKPIPAAVTGPNDIPAAAADTPTPTLTVE